MGAKTNVSQAPTVTPEQKALLDSMMRGVYNQMQGFNLGAGWAGPSFESYNPGAGYGGKAFDMTAKGAPVPPSFQARMTDKFRNVFDRMGGARQANPYLAVLQSIARPAAAPGAPGAAGGPGGVLSPTSTAFYNNRENLVSPVVNPFRRNLGG